MGRFHQLQKTLPKNLEAISGFEHVDLVIFFAPTSDHEENLQTRNFLRKWKKKYPKSLKIFTGKLANGWHAPIAKNTAHVVSTSEFIMNLDVDNFLSTARIQDIITNLRNQPVIKTLLTGFSGTWGDGTYGNIGMSRYSFKRLGGYDQKFSAMGFQDADLIKRHKKMFGSTAKRLSSKVTPPLLNTKSEGLNLAATHKEYDELKRENSRVSFARLASAREKNDLQVNQECDFLGVEAEKLEFLE